jgi:hypothetical protein
MKNILIDQGNMPGLPKPLTVTFVIRNMYFEPGSIRSCLSDYLFQINSLQTSM